MSSCIDATIKDFGQTIVSRGCTSNAMWRAAVMAEPNLFDSTMGIKHTQIYTSFDWQTSHMHHLACQIKLLEHTLTHPTVQNLWSPEKER